MTSYRGEPMQGRKIRVLIGKVGLDGHDRGAKIVAHHLRNAGMEVIYTGIRQTVEQVVSATVQEDVDVIGISSMVGAHLAIVKKLQKELEALSASDIPIIMGGIIPEEDFGPLHDLGVRKIFPPGSEVKEIVRYIRSVLEPLRGHMRSPGA